METLFRHFTKITIAFTTLIDMGGCSHKLGSGLSAQVQITGCAGVYQWWFWRYRVTTARSCFVTFEFERNAKTRINLSS